MSNIEEIIKKASSNFTDEQVNTFATDFLLLQKEFDEADIDDLNDDDYREDFVSRFDSLFVALGFDEFDLENTEHILYNLYVSGYQGVIGFVTVSYRQVCYETDILCDVYNSMLEDEGFE